jgi:hypothetical protein
MTLVSKRRQQARIWETRVLVEAALAPHAKENSLSDFMNSYVNALFPYLAHRRDSKDAQAKKALKEWTSNKKLAVKPLWMAKKGQPSLIHSRMQRTRTRKLEARNGSR